MKDYPLIIKVGILCILCFGNPHMSSAQLTDPEKAELRQKYFTSFQALNQKYVCVKGPGQKNQHAQPDALDSSFRPIFGTVILNNDDLATNATAGSITQDKDKASLGFNYTFLNKKLQDAFNVGISSTSSGSTFDLYSKKSWQKGGNITFGWSRINANNAQTYQVDDCQKLIDKRNLFISSRLGQIFEILELDAAHLRNEETDLKNRIDFARLSSEGDILPLERSYKEDIEALEKIQLQLRQYDSFITKRRDLTGASFFDAKKIDILTLKDLVKYDMANAKFTGYRVKWSSLTGTIGFANNKIYNDTLTTNDSLLNFFTKDFLRAKLSFSRSYSSLQKKYLSFFSWGISIYNTNFLENKKISEIPILRYDEKLKKVVIKDNENETLGSLNELKNVVWAFNPGLYYSIFPGKKKILGIEGIANYTIYTNTPKDIPMPNSFNTTIGLLFRVITKEPEKNPLPKATVGLIFGLFSAEEETKVWREAFGLQFKVGVPFSAILSKNSEK